MMNKNFITCICICEYVFDEKLFSFESTNQTITKKFNYKKRNYKIRVLENLFVFHFLVLKITKIKTCLCFKIFRIFYLSHKTRYFTNLRMI